ncbi:MAG TPA: methyltransferase domain-containing protein [Nocardioidaceae bacterium]|nr:methyltransferase domain-containing protein [Nocardioidaceae bacterium]
MTPSPILVNQRGITLPASVDDSCDVSFDGATVWSFTPSEKRVTDDGTRFVEWPKVMRNWLDGLSEVTVTQAGKELFRGVVRFGEGQERIRFVDKDGIPVMVDKWGLLQRPFSGRGQEVVSRMVDTTEAICEVLERECGVQAWIAFGTLLGAAREGKVIGHDSDIDLAYLSDKATPAAMALELFEMSRTLRRHGMTVLNKSGSFITVVFSAPDGGQSSIDIYTCFYVGDLLHETATVRARVPRTAIEPIGRIEFEGRMLPAPADPDALLTASYGPKWRIPDPSFTHRPGPEIKQRFDPWFGSVMRHRRDWEGHFRLVNSTPGRQWAPSDFARWVRHRLEPGARILDVGCGGGEDTTFFATRGHEALGLDYARGATNKAVRRSRRRNVPATFDSLNLYDLRDVLTRAALLRREHDDPLVLYARGLVDSLEPDGLDNFWRFADVVLRGRGTAYLEFGGPHAKPGPGSGGRRFRLEPVAVERAVHRAGGRVVELEQVPVSGKAGTDEDLCRMAVEWAR